MTDEICEDQKCCCTPDDPPTESVDGIHNNSKSDYFTFAASLPILQILSVGTGLIIPLFLKPQHFGNYSLLTAIMGYVWLCDLGLAHAASRLIPYHLGKGEQVKAKIVSEEILWLRGYIACAAGCLSMLVTIWLVKSGILNAPMMQVVLAVLAGCLYLLANGPRSIYRAFSNVKYFTRANIIIEFGSSIPRLIGLIVGGLQGIFSALVLWYGAAAILLNVNLIPDRDNKPTPERILQLLSISFPLFTASYAWGVYLTISRFSFAAVATPEELGLFTFGLSISGVGITVLGAYSQIYYPRIAAQIAAGPELCCSDKIVKDLLILMMGAFALSAISLPILPYFIQFLYSAYSAAIGPTRILMIGMPVIVVSAWLLNISLSGGKSPLKEGTITVLMGISVLFLGIRMGYNIGGMNAAAWAYPLAAIILLSFQLLAVTLGRILSVKHAILVWNCAVFVLSVESFFLKALI